eukprot:11221343-Lingulodinium_polyedra.AAC.1
MHPHHNAWGNVTRSTRLAALTIHRRVSWCILWKTRVALRTTFLPLRAATRGLNACKTQRWQVDRTSQNATHKW